MKVSPELALAAFPDSQAGDFRSVPLQDIENAKFKYLVHLQQMCDLKMNLPDFEMIEVNQLLMFNAQKHNLKAGDIFPWSIIQSLLSIKKLSARQKAAILREDGSTPALDILINKGYFKKVNLDYVLTKSGEDFLCDPRNKFPELKY